VAKDPRFAGAYVGNRPDAKPENYMSRAIPLDEFMRVLAEGIEEFNTRAGRLTDTARGRSFAETFAESYATAPIRKATEEQRRLWLMGQQVVKLHQRHGRATLLGGEYWSDWMSEAFGRALLPTVRSLAEAVSPLALALSDLAAAHPAVVQAAATLVAGLFALRVAALATRFGFAQVRIALAVLQGGFGGAVLAVSKLASAFIWLGQAALANPIVAAVAVIAGLAYVIYRNWDGIVAYFQEKIDRVRAAFDQGLLNGVLKALSEFNPFVLVMDGAVGLFTYLTDWDLSFLSDKLREAVGVDLYDAGVQMLQSAWNGMLSILGPMVSSIVSPASRASASLSTRRSGPWWPGSRSTCPRA
jgi:hypothetical protein